MVLAAGLGLRMRPITDNLPKPLVPVLDRTLLDRVLDRLDEAGVEETVVNLHHLGKMIERHLSDRRTPKIILSVEETRLETGGGVAKALPLLGDTPFFVVNGDVLWLDGPCPTFDRLTTAWDEDRMDALLLLHPTVEAFGYHGDGDFLMDPEGRLIRRPEREIAPYLFAGIQILHPRLFEDTPAGSFSLNLLYDQAIEHDRLFGVLHDGKWFHVGTPEDLAVAENYMRARHFGVRLR
jgi:MurNAc alpha-1-phosphate uridylyltransferase